MRNENFKQTEKALYNHYEYLKEIEVIDRELDLLQKQYENIESRLRNTDYSIQEQSRAMGFEERVQSSGDGTSYAESQILQFAEEDIKEQKYINERVFKLNQKKRKLERDTISLKYNIDMLCDEYKRFIELKYRDKKKMEEICIEVNRSRSSAFELRDKVVEDIARWLNII